MHCSQGALTSTSFALGATALGTIALAVATDSWLITEEKVLIKENFGNESVELSFVFGSRIGLWRYCIVYSDEMVQLFGTSKEHCILIEYLLGLKSEKVEEQPISHSIGEAQMGATPLFVLGLLLMVIATVLLIVGNFKTDIKTLIASILYINGGLCLAVGIILYITFVNDEASHHTKPSSEETYFRYHYGWSAYLVGFSFITSEAVAVVGIYLFMSHHSKPEDVIKIIPGLEDKLKSETSCKHPLDHSCHTLIL